MSADDRERQLLRAALLSGDLSEEGTGATTGQVWAAARGELPAEEMGEVLDAVARDEVSARAWLLARELATEPEAEGVPVPVAMPPEAPAVQGARRSGAHWLRAAAVAVVLLGAGLLAWRWSEEPSREPVYRGGEGAIVALTPETRTVSREDLILRWTPSPQAVRYSVRLLTEDLVPVALVSGLERPEYPVPESDLLDLPSGAQLVWQVEASHPDGSTELSPMFRLQIE